MGNFFKLLVNQSERDLKDADEEVTAENLAKAMADNLTHLDDAGRLSLSYEMLKAGGALDNLSSPHAS
jgi:hypothetical protein